MNVEQFKIHRISKEFLKNNIDSFIRILADVPGEYWDENNFLFDLPGKWDYSVVILNLEQKILGYIIASEKKDSIHIHKFMIDQQYRGKGLGNYLLDSFISLFINSAYSIITLKVLINNISAISFYRKNQFEIVNSDNSYHLMQKKL